MIKKQQSIKIVNASLYGKFGYDNLLDDTWFTIFDKFLLEERRKKIEKIKNNNNFNKKYD